MRFYASDGDEASVLNGFVQNVRKQSGAFEGDLRDNLVIDVENSLDSAHFRIAFVAIQRKTMRRGLRAVETRPESIRREPFVRVVVLQHVPHRRNRFLILVELASTEGVRVVIVQRVDHLVVPIAGREIDRHHEVQIQTALYELQKVRLCVAGGRFDENGAME